MRRKATLILSAVFVFLLTTVCLVAICQRSLVDAQGIAMVYSTDTNRKKDREAKGSIVITLLQKGGVSIKDPFFQDSPERRCSSRTFRYGYLVTT